MLLSLNYMYTTSVLSLYYTYITIYTYVLAEAVAIYKVLNSIYCLAIRQTQIHNACHRRITHILIG